MLTTQTLYTLFILVIAIERIVELALSRRNAAWSFARGGKEYGREHYPIMVIIHSGLLMGCLLETWLCGRPFDPSLGIPFVVLALVCQFMRYCIIATLGKHWNTRVIVVPGAERIASGPYRIMPHPNYLVVIIEGIALPVIHSNWITAVAFTLANLLLLKVRIRCENDALQTLAGQ